MNTLEFDTRLRHRRAVPMTAAVSKSPDAAPSIDVPVVVLSQDPALCAAIRSAAAGQFSVLDTSTLEQALDLAASGRCGILVTDQVLGQAALTKLSGQMRAHDPAIITIAVGSRGDDDALIGLLSSAVVERFMLKPVQPALARLVLRSAATEYRSAQSRRRSDTLLKEHLPQVQAPPPAADQHVLVAAGAADPPLRKSPMTATPTLMRAPEPAVAVETRSAPAVATEAAPAAPRGISPLPWLAAVAAVMVAIAATWAVMRQRVPDIDPQQVIATSLERAQAAYAAGKYVEPAESSAVHHFSTVLALDPANAAARQGMQQTVDRLVDSVKTLIVEGRLAEAGVLLERTRGISSDQRRLTVLEEQLRKAQAEQLLALNARVVAPVAAAAKTEVVPDRRSTPGSVAAKKSTAAAQTEFVLPGQSPAADLASYPTENVPDPLPIAEVPASAALDTAAAGAVVTAPPVTAAPVVADHIGAAPMVAATTAVKDEVQETSAPKLIKLVEPEYPTDARAHGIQGSVDLTLAVNAAGRVTDARIDSSSRLRMFDKAALAAVRKWQYEPRALADANAVQPVRVRVQFKLED